jgi:hypothetical protein
MAEQSSDRPDRGKVRRAQRLTERLDSCEMPEDAGRPTVRGRRARRARVRIRKGWD